MKISLIIATAGLSLISGASLRDSRAPEAGRSQHSGNKPSKPTQMMSDVGSISQTNSSPGSARESQANTASSTNRQAEQTSSPRDISSERRIYEQMMNHHSLSVFLDKYVAFAGLDSTQAAIDNLWEYKGAELGPLLSDPSLSSNVFRESFKFLVSPAIAPILTIIDAYLSSLEEVKAKIDRYQSDEKNHQRRLSDPLDILNEISDDQMYGRPVDLVIGPELCLGGRNFRDISRLGSVTGLRRLVLHQCPITDDDIAHLTRLTELESLSLLQTEATDACIEHLLQIKGLKVVRLEGLITDAAKRTLRFYLKHRA